MKYKIEIDKMKVLNLTLKKKWFDLMVTGKKNIEVRRPSPWIISRLWHNSGMPKDIDFVKFVNGYGKDKPYFIAEINGLDIADEDREIKYDNTTLSIKKLDIVIELGEIIEVGNLNTFY